MLILFGIALLILLVTFWPYSEATNVPHAAAFAPETPAPPLNDDPSAETAPQSGPVPNEPRWSLRYAAACPACGYRVGRREFWRCQDPLAVTCAQCDSRLKSVRAWDYGWGLLLALPSGILLALALVGAIGWLPGIVAFMLHLAAGHILFPYITKLELVTPPLE